MRDLESVYDVQEHPEMEGCWQVVPYRGGEPLRSHANVTAAWHHACWQYFHETNTLPEISPGNWFVSTSGKGWTADPRWAVAVPAEKVTEDERKRIDRAIVRFIRAKVGDMEPLEAFFPDDMTPETLAESERLVNGVPAPQPGGREPEVEHVPECNPECDPPEHALIATESPADGLSGEPRTSPPAEESEPVRTALSDSEPEKPEGYDRLSPVEQNAWDNFSDLAQTAPSEPARIYSRNRASEIFAGVLS